MPETTTDIVAKLWNLCHVLRDDGITYHQYVSELTYLLFLKMAKETKTEAMWCGVTSRRSQIGLWQRCRSRR